MRRSRTLKVKRYVWRETRLFFVFYMCLTYVSFVLFSSRKPARGHLQVVDEDVDVDYHDDDQATIVVVRPFMRGIPRHHL